MTETVMVGLAGAFPLVNIDSGLRIETGPATEVELTPWVVSQLAAGSLVKFDADGEPEPNVNDAAVAAAAAEAAATQAAAEAAAAEAEAATTSGKRKN